MDIKDRILQFIKSENLNSTRFSQEIGVQKSRVSHILSGRNQPSYDFIEKILIKYPKIDANWLILGTGSMFKSKNSDQLVNNTTKNNVDPLPENNLNLFSDSKDAKPEENFAKDNRNIEYTNVNNVEKIVFFYSNGTFDIFLNK